MLRRFSPEETLTLCMLFLLNILIIFSGQLSKAYHYFFLNLALISVIFLLTYLPLSWRWVRDWYIIIYLLVIFFENGTLVPLINPYEMDEFLIQADRLLFGGHDPSLFLGKWVIPPFVEILQIVYASFYFLPLLLCLLLYVKKRDKRDFHLCASSILLGFYLSYIGYYLCPALGPRFTLEHLQEKPLVGLWSFTYVRELLAWMEGKMYDCMPSGHTLVSLLTALLARRYFRPFYAISLIWALLMVVSTVYLRYHYVWDVIMGVALVIPVYALTRRWEENPWFSQTGRS
ncbi:MAG: phosphatase PAP2 family protein [Syntrophales bacterium]|nr:phosphatase PAP2 family protein [Syntrophales bacterium]